jgi:hypothetical protein
MGVNKTHNLINFLSFANIARGYNKLKILVLSKINPELASDTAIDCHKALLYNFL